MPNNTDADSREQGANEAANSDEWAVNRSQPSGSQLPKKLR